MIIRDRVKSFRRVLAKELRPNSRNWRKHPQAQHDALRGVLSEIGFAGAVLVRELDGGSLMLIDGHLRAETLPDQEIPVLVLDVTEAEADKLLATFDPLSAMAEADSAALDDLLRDVNTDNEALRQMLSDLSENAGLYDVDEAKTPELSGDDKSPFQQMTFTLHDEQAETVKDAIRRAKDAGSFDDSPNVDEGLQGRRMEAETGFPASLRVFSRSDRPPTVDRAYNSL